MKPPHPNRHGGSGRPPSDRGPFRGGGGSSTPQSGHSQSGDRQPRRDHGGQGLSSGQGQNPGQGGGFGGQLSRPRAGRALRPVAQPARRGPGPAGKPFQGRPSKQSGQNREPNRDRGQRDHAAQNTPDAPRGAVWLYGQHSVAAALANPGRRLRRLLLTEEAQQTLTQRLLPPWPLQPEPVDRGRLDHLLGRDIAHQGAALLADPLGTPSLQHALERPGPLIVLDQVTDPRNIGAILRSAAAFGVAAVITQDRNAPEETGAMAKAASGALETVPLLRAVNIARTLIALNASNIWTVGLEGGGPPLSGPSLADRRVALVLGAEGDGMRRLTRETCDEVAGIQMPGKMDSLNVSAAAAVALYELTRRT